MPEVADDPFAVESGDESDDNPGHEWILGATINVCGNILINLGKIHSRHLFAAALRHFLRPLY